MSPVERCIVPASQMHGVNPHVLRAILRVESGLKPDSVNVNANGTKDVGIGQMNSIHFPALMANGIAPRQLLDPCVGTYVAAWHLSKLIADHGNSWEAIARYHSATPYFNHRYQVLLNNELVKAGAITSQMRPVPAMKSPDPKRSVPRDAESSSDGAHVRTSIVIDDGSASRTREVLRANPSKETHARN